MLPPLPDCHESDREIWIGGHLAQVRKVGLCLHRLTLDHRLVISRSVNTLRVGSSVGG